MTQTILVTSLQLEAVSGSTCYASENGFSSVSGSVRTDDPKIASVLDHHVRSGEPTAVRCGLLEVFGVLQIPTQVETHQEYAIYIRAVTYGAQEPSSSGA